jgi:hypothetical protein
MVMEEILEAVRRLGDEEGLACERIISDYEESIFCLLFKHHSKLRIRLGVGSTMEKYVSNHKFHCASF